MTKLNERRKRPCRRRPLPPDQIELSRQNIPSHQPVTINPLALELLKKFNNEISSISSSSLAIDSNLICESDSDKATQTYTRVSVGTECCSLTNTDIPRKTTEQKSSQTQSRIRMYKQRIRNSMKRTTTTTTSTTTDDVPSPITFYNTPANVFNVSTMTQWENLSNNDIETPISSTTRSDMSIQTVGHISNILDYSSENNSVNVQTLPISMTSTQMQTITEYPIEQSTTEYNNNNNYYLLPYQESVGTSCFLDEFLLDDLSKNDSSSSVLFDFDAMDLLDLIDNGTQTYPLITSHETQTITEWDSMLLNEDEWIGTMMNN